MLKTNAHRAQDQAALDEAQAGLRDAAHKLARELEEYGYDVGQMPIRTFTEIVHHAAMERHAKMRTEQQHVAVFQMEEWVDGDTTSLGFYEQGEDE